MHGDTNATFLAGDAAEEDRLLVERTHEATMRAIKAVRPGRALNVVGRVIESYARRFGYGVVRDFTGHGIGRDFHSGLVVLHYDDPAVTTVLEEGMTFTIEPMITLGTAEYDMWDDGWTVLTKDRRRTAQFEHTIVVTAAGPRSSPCPERRERARGQCQGRTVEPEDGRTSESGLSVQRGSGRARRAPVRPAHRSGGAHPRVPV